MRLYFFATCPYCGHPNKFYTEIESLSDKMMVFTCEVEEGGCDLPFVVKLELKPVITTQGIDGMMEAYQEDQAEKNYEGPVGLQHP